MMFLTVDYKGDVMRRLGPAVPNAILLIRFGLVLTFLHLDF